MKGGDGDEIEIKGVAHLICVISAERVSVRNLVSGTTKEIRVSDFVQLAALVGMGAQVD